MPRHIAFLIYPDFQILDITGPIAAFEIAGRIQPGAYALRLIAVKSGLVSSSSGFSLQASGLSRPGAIDTLIIAGGGGSRVAAACDKTKRFVQACAQRSVRIASVCSGTYLLAAAGLLNGKRATTHWGRACHLQSEYPDVNVDAEPIYIQSGNLWTSAGITSGIDLALALIAQDLGESVARRTAQQMVVYYRRPGGQSQFSALLDIDGAESRFTGLLEHMRANLRRPLAVTDLAERANMSPRHFARAFRAATGSTPAKAVERMRIDAARAALDSGERSIEAIARAYGFGAPERMRRAFIRTLGRSPTALKRRVHR